jgi:SPP1 gp7 family putative phage head morphogenesis protein
MHLRSHLRHLVQQRPGKAMRVVRGRKAKPIKPSRANELWYKSQLLAITRLLRQATEREIIGPLRKVPVQVGDARAKMVKGPAVNISVSRKVFDDGVKKVASQFGGIQTTADRLSALAVQKNLQEVDTRLAASIKSSVSVDISGVLTNEGAIRTAVREATEANVALIRSIPEQYLQKLSDNFFENLVDGVDVQDLVSVISHVADVTDSRAKLIARDQTSKMNSSFNRVRQTDLGIERYQWQTAGDERVRETHADNDGKIFSWDDPPEETGNPGDDINCRCVAIPVFDLEEGPDGEDEIEDDEEDTRDDDTPEELDNENADD